MFLEVDLTSCLVLLRRDPYIIVGYLLYEFKAQVSDHADLI